MKKIIKEWFRNNLELNSLIKGEEITKENVKYELIKNVIAFFVELALGVWLFILGLNLEDKTIVALGLFLLLGAVILLFAIVEEIVILKYYSEIMNDMDDSPKN